MENVLPSEFACKQKIYLVGKIQFNKRLKQKFLWMEGELFCKLLAQTKVRLTTNNTSWNIMIISSLV